MGYSVTALHIGGVDRGAGNSQPIHIFGKTIKPSNQKVEWCTVHLLLHLWLPYKDLVLRSVAQRHCVNLSSLNCCTVVIGIDYTNMN